MSIGAIASARVSGSPRFGCWGVPLADDEPVDPDSALIAARFAYMAERLSQSSPANWGPTLTMEAPLFIVPLDQPLVPMPFDHQASTSELQESFRAGVPIPDEFAVTADVDQNALIWQPGTDCLWVPSVSQQFIWPMEWHTTPLVGASGGSLPAGSIQYRVTATSANGETTAPSAASFTSAGGGGSNTKITPQWCARYLATSYIVYRKRPDDATWTRLITLTPASNPTLFADDVYVVSWQDDGTATPENTNAAPPGTNTATTTEWRCRGGAFGRSISSHEPYWPQLASGYQPAGGTATAVPMLAGLISMRDWERGECNHALRHHIEALGQYFKTVRVRATAGQWTLAYGAETTGNLVYNASAATVQTAFRALSTVPDDVEVTGGPGDANGTTPYRFWFPAGGAGTMASANGTTPLSGGNPTGFVGGGGIEDRTRWAYPAQSGDLATVEGSGHGGIPLGARLRFSPTLEEPTWTGSANEQKLARMIFRAIQRYGMIATDGTAMWGINHRQDGIEDIFPPGSATQHSALMQVFSPANCAAMEVVEMGVCTNKNIPCPVEGQ